MTKRVAARLLALLINMAAFSAAAADISISGYATLGFARSDQPYTYQRFIDDRGTFQRDSVAGLQFDAKFNNQFGATVQFKVAAALNDDSGFDGTVAWALLSYRPTNDWLFRFGRQRIPLYLYSQNLDVGVTYDFARLPTEMYSISPSNDFDGVSFAKNWVVGAGELTLDAYYGKSTTYTRFWTRDNIPPIQSSGANFFKGEIKGGGFVVTYKQADDTYRIGLTHVDFKLIGAGIPTTFPFVPLLPGIGYHQVDDSIPGPGVPKVDSLPITVFTLGAEVGVGAGFRVIGEFARNFISNDLSTPSTRGYVSLLRPVDKWTPYVIYAFLRSTANVRQFYKSVNYNTVPDFIPGAALINASQRSGADSISAYDQSSWAVGTSYSFSPTSKLKAEFLRAHIGEVSSLVDAPSGANIRNQNINVFSLSYNVVF